MDDLRLLVADLSSAREKGELSIGRVPDTGTLGSVQVSGTLALLPRRFSKWLDQFSKRFLAEPPFILTEEPEFCLKDLLLFSRQDDVFGLRVLQTVC